MTRFNGTEMKAFVLKLDSLIIDLDACVSKSIQLYHFYQFRNISFQSMCSGVGSNSNSLDPNRSELRRVVPLYPGYHKLSRSTNLCCLCPGSVLEENQRKGENTESLIYISF